MTVHRAKGLEFPVVILADVTANMTPQRPSRHVDPARGLCALGLARWLPLDLLDHEAEEMARERAEGVRVAYVAATRARDLLVVPAVGDDPFAVDPDLAESGWVAPLQRALYPAADRRRTPAPAPGCPAFGEDSVLAPRRRSAGPGQRAPGPARAGRGRRRVSRRLVGSRPARPRRSSRSWGCAATICLKEVRGVAEADLARYDEWQAARRATLERGARPSLVVRPITEWARAPEARAARSRRRSTSRSSTSAWGAITRPARASAPSCTPCWPPSRSTPPGPPIAEGAELQARILGASAEETTAAREVVGAMLAHPLMARAREAFARGRCRRETPVAGVGPDGVLLEGILDLAFEDDAGMDDRRLQDLCPAGRCGGPLPAPGGDVRVARAAGDRPRRAGRVAAGVAHSANFWAAGWTTPPGPSWETPPRL